MLDLLLAALVASWEVVTVVQIVNISGVGSIEEWMSWPSGFYLNQHMPYLSLTEKVPVLGCIEKLHKD